MRILYCTMLFVLASCTKDKIGTPTITPITPIGSNIVQSGSFTATAGITVQGKAKIIIENTNRQVLLDSFSISNGPDLKVYLSSQNTPANFVNLGALKSATGNSSYSIPNNIVLSNYPFVLIHCQQYNHLFAFAKIQ
jgi:hypothetical protein